MRSGRAWWVAAAWLLAWVQAARADVDTRSCVDVQIGDQQFYDCLNRKFRSAVPAGRPAPLAPLNAAGIAAPTAGIFNHAATHERMGNAFGHSVLPQRPAPPVYVNPLVPSRPR